MDEAGKRWAGQVAPTGTATAVIERQKRRNSLPMNEQELRDLGLTEQQANAVMKAAGEEAERQRAALEAVKGAAVRGAYRRLLESCGLTGRRADAVMKVTDMTGMELDEAGGLCGEEALKAGVRAEWGDLIPTTRTRGAEVAAPPAGTRPDPFEEGFDGAGR